MPGSYRGCLWVILCQTRLRLSWKSGRVYAPARVGVQHCQLRQTREPHVRDEARHQGLTLVHFSAKRKHVLLDTLGA